MSFLFGLGVGMSLGASLGVLVASLLRASRDGDCETPFAEPDGSALRKAAESSEASRVVC